MEIQKCPGKDEWDDSVFGLQKKIQEYKTKLKRTIKKECTIYNDTWHMTHAMEEKIKLTGQ